MTEAYSAVKNAFLKATLLAHPSMSASVAVMSDASDRAVHQINNGALQNLRCDSGKLSDSMTNYSRHYKELIINIIKYTKFPSFTLRKGGYILH